MTSETASAVRSGKSHRDENFPVASRLIHARHRGIILAFYNFVRTADDIADHATLEAQEKLRLLDAIEQGLLGTGDGGPEATSLRLALNERGLSPRHAQNLLTAFRMDVTKLRYRDWADLMDYCSYSAMPVGRFVLDVHGEDTNTWVASDALCAALQVINHLQDCKRDYLDLDRVYVPMDALTTAGSDVAALGKARASPALAQCLHGLARRTQLLLHVSDPLPAMVADFRLSLEISVIQSLARRLNGILASRDPLSEPVHLGKAAVLGVGGGALISGILRRFGRRMTAGLRRPRET
jgi:squalene synthase HpnC